MVSSNSAPGRSCSYWVCVITRNGANVIGQTLNSLVAQTVPPRTIVVVDDGSTDGTESIVTSYLARKEIRVKLIRLPDRGYDIRRVPANLNEAYALVESTGEQYKHSMISGDDCLYPNNYSEFLLSEMEKDPRLVIASGDWGMPSSTDNVKVPQGSGRFIRNSFWKSVGGKYPVAYGWESWLLFKALEFDYRIANFANLRYRHLRPSGHTHKFAHWGIAMRALGYHPLMVISRFMKNVLFSMEPISPLGNLRMILTYFVPQLYRSDPYYQDFDMHLKHFVRARQLQKVRESLNRLVYREGILPSKGMKDDALLDF